jgi:hypothetical protein
MRKRCMQSVAMFSLVTYLACCGVAAPTPVQIGNPLMEQRQAQYKLLVERIRKGDNAVDFVELIATYWDIYPTLPKSPVRAEMNEENHQLSK